MTNLASNAPAADAETVGSVGLAAEEDFGDSPEEGQVTQGGRALNQQIRGSSMLVAGRGVSLAINLIAQVLTVRYLTKSDFGAIAWAFSGIELLSLLTLCGMNKSLARFGAIYHQRNQASHFRGAILFPIVATFLLGGGVAVWLSVSEAHLVRLLNIDANTGVALKTMAVLIPLNAFGSLSLSVYTVMGKAQTVFLRRQLLGPAIRMLAVLIAILADGGLMGIALAWLASGIIAFLIDVALTTQLLRQDEVFQTAKHTSMLSAGRDLLSYGIPILSSDLAYMIRSSLLVLLLGWLSVSTATAAFRAVLPLVRLNELVLVNFTLVFTPLASRLFADDRRHEFANLFRSTTLWALVLSFPVFAFCVTFSHHITFWLFGAEYADAPGLLIVLSLGYMMQVFVGFNSRILKIDGHLRVFVTLDLINVLVSLGLSVLLIPRFGAMGAALGVTGGLAVDTVIRYATVRVITGWSPWTEESWPVFLVVGILAISLSVLQLFWPQRLLIVMLLAPASSLLVVLLARRHLKAGAHFPELLRIPFVRRLLPTR